MDRLKEHFLAFFTVLIWGLTFVCTKYLSDEFSPLEILFVRYIIAYAALWIMCPKPFFFTNWKNEGLMLLAALSGAAVYQFLENLSVSYTSPASVSFITATAPIFTGLLAHKVFGERFDGKSILGMIISVVGIFFICFGDAGKFETGLLGDVIIFSSIWLWAVYSVLVKKISAFGYHGFLVTRRLFFYSVIVMTPFIAATGDISHINAIFKPSAVCNLLFLGILASAVCFAAWNRAVEHLGATVTSKYLFISPIITLLVEFALGDTKIGISALFGMAVTLLGIGISEFEIKKNKGVV